MAGGGPQISSSLANVAFCIAGLSLCLIQRAHVPSAGTPLALSLALIGNSEQWEEMKFGSSQGVKTE